MAYIESANMEKQVNRVATATAILKASNEMLYRMPISADAKWVEDLSRDISPASEKSMQSKLLNDPFFATVQLTDIASRNMGTLFSKLTPAESYLYETLEKLYASYPPDIYTLSSNIDELQKFKGGKLKNISAMSGDKYNNIGEAILSLVPVNIKKDLKKSIDDYNKAGDAVAKKKETIAKLSKDDAAKKANAEKITFAETELRELEKTTDEKEKIMDEFWKKAVAELDTNINEKKMKLVRKIQTVLSVVDDGAILAGCTYATALAKGYSSLMGLSSEIQMLGVSRAAAVANAKMNDLMQKRIERLSRNAVMALPNIAVGVYLIAKQQVFVSKYNDVVNKLVKADNDTKKTPVVQNNNSLEPTNNDNNSKKSTKKKKIQ